MRQQEHHKPGRGLSEAGTVQAFHVVLAGYWALYLLAKLYPYHIAGTPGDELKLYVGLYAERVLRDLWLWQLATHSFLHDNLFLLLFNSSALLLVAPDLERRWGAPRFLAYLLAATVGGGLLSCLAAETGAAFGASGVVMAATLGVAVAVPERIWFGILRGKHLCWLVLVVEAVACLFLLDEDRQLQIRRLPHLALVFGGLISGWMFMRAEPGVERTLHVWRKRREIRRKREMVRVRRRVDELLEKIRYSGMDALSRRERAFLTRASRLYRREIGVESELAHRD